MKIKRLSNTEYLVYSLIIAVGIAIDQLTKWLTVENFAKEGESFTLIPGIVNLTYVRNAGAAFGMLANARAVFIVISALMIAVFLPVLYLGISDSKLSRVAIAMVVSGGIGNMIDRLGNADGKVVDFIEPTFVDFAIFNGADSFVCVGAGLLILALLLEMYDEKKKADAAKLRNGDDKNDADGE